MASPAQMPTSIGYVWKNQAPAAVHPRGHSHLFGLRGHLLPQVLLLQIWSRQEPISNPAGGSVAFLSGPKAPPPPVQLMLQQWYFQALVCLAPDLSK